MPGTSRFALTPTIMKAATKDPFTGAQLTSLRPYTAKEKYEALNPMEGRTRAPLRPLGGMTRPRPALRRGYATEPGASYAPDDGRRIGSKLGAMPALTSQDWMDENDGLSNPAASKRLGSLDTFYKMNPKSGSDFARKALLEEATDFLAVGDDAGRRTAPPLVPYLAQNTIRGYAEGGLIPEGELALVGEEGPELVRSTGNTQVVPLKPMQPGMLSAMLPAPRNFADPMDPPVRNAGPGLVPLPAKTAPAWNPGPRELLGQPAEVGSVGPPNLLETDPWMQKKVNHLAMRELAKDPVTLVKMQLGLLSAEEAARAAGAKFQLEERGRDRRALMKEEGQSERQKVTQSFQKEQAEAKLAREKEEKLIKDAAAGEALAVNAIIARSLAAQGKVPKELAEAIAGMKSVEEQNQALNRVDYGSTGRAFAQERPSAMPMQDVTVDVPGTPSWAPMAPQLPGVRVTGQVPMNPEDVEPVPVEWDPATGKATKHALRPKRVVVDRDKTMEQLVKLYGIRDSLDKPLPKSARPRIEREITRLEQALDADGDGRPDGPGMAPAGAEVAPGAGGVAPAGGGVVPKWQERLKK